MQTSEAPIAYMCGVRAPCDLAEPEPTGCSVTLKLINAAALSTFEPVETVRLPTATLGNRTARPPVTRQRSRWYVVASRDDKLLVETHEIASLRESKAEAAGDERMEANANTEQMKATANIEPLNQAEAGTRQALAEFPTPQAFSGGADRQLLSTEAGKDVDSFDHAAFMLAEGLSCNFSQVRCGCGKHI